MEVASNPRRAKGLRQMWSSCVRRSCPVIRTRGWVGATASTARVLISSSCRAATGDPLLGRPADVVDPPGLLEPADEPGAGVELAAKHAMTCGGRVGVVQVVP